MYFYKTIQNADKSKFKYWNDPRYDQFKTIINKMTQDDFEVLKEKSEVDNFYDLTFEDFNRICGVLGIGTKHANLCPKCGRELKGLATSLYCVCGYTQP